MDKQKANCTQRASLLPIILDRHGKRVNATKDQITLKVPSLKLEKTIIVDEIKSPPTDCKLMTEKQEIEDQIL